MKNTEWGQEYGCGVISCMCDNCSATEEYEFDECNPDYREAQEHIKSLGWLSTQVQGAWKDFCSESCRNGYIRKNT